MKSSSASQLDLFAEPPSGFTAERQNASVRTTRTSAHSGEEFPSFDTYSVTQAETARITSRLIAASISETEYRKLLDERQQLLDKLMDETITQREINRLEYVRWSLDRIEDAKHGQSLDILEDAIGRYEHFLNDLDDFKDALLRASQRRA